MPGVPPPILRTRAPEGEVFADEEGIEPREIGVGGIDLAHHADIAVPQLLPAQPERNDIGAIGGAVGRIEPPFLRQPRMERRLRDGGKHAGHRLGNPSLGQETALGVEDRRVVVVEAHDHAAPDLDPGALNPMHLLDHAAAGADVLEFLCLAQRGLIGALDADEDGDDVGLDHQRHQLRIIGEVDGRFGEEGQGIAFLLLPVRQRAQHRLDGLLVADEVVVDDEDRAHSLTSQRGHLGDDLRAGLETGTPAEHDDDVAELAGKGAAPRKLYAAVEVMLHFQEIEARHRHMAHVGALALLIAPLMARVGPIGQKARPGLLGLADEDDIGEIGEICLVDGDPRAAHDGEDPAPLQLGENLGHAEALNAHARDADDIGGGAALEIDCLDVLIDQRDAMGRGRQRRQQRQARDRQIGRFAEEGEGVLDPPVGHLEARIDDDYVGHSSRLKGCIVSAAAGLMPETV